MENTEIYLKAIDKWGKQLQMVLLMEEMSELAKEVSKRIRGKPDYDHMAEEIVDVEIMLGQLKLIGSKEYTKFDENINSHKKRKIRRLEKLVRDTTRTQG